MTRKEKFGKFVLLEEIEKTGLGAEYRAAKLSATGLEKIVTLFRFAPAITANADAARLLMDQAKAAAQLQNPNVVKVLGIGKVESSYYVSSEFVEAKSLRAILRRAKQDGFPFSVDHALLVASKVCAALEYAHGRRAEDGSRMVHGLMAPEHVLVSYEGEVRSRGFGLWPAQLREFGLLGPDESAALSPEQAAGGKADARSDVFAVGALLFEALTGQHPFANGRTEDFAGLLAAARLANPTTDDDRIPAPIAEILGKSLAPAAARYADMAEMRKAIDTLLFTGDFTPTTFNLAFFMHSLFREDIDRESRALKEEREYGYAEYLVEDKPAAPVVVPAPSAPEPARAYAPESAPAPAPVHHTPASPAPSQPAIAIPGGAQPAGKSSMPMIVGGLAAVVVIAVGAWFMLGRSTPEAAAPAPTTLSPEAAAAMRKVQELEQKLAALEAEKQAEEQLAAEEAEKKLKAQAAAKGQQVDPAALAKAQEEARKKAAAEAEARQQAELQRIAEEKKAEEARLAEEKRRADEAAKAAAAATPPPTTVAAAPVTQAPATQPAAAPAALKPGTLVNLSDPGVIEPIVDRSPALHYPPIALRQRVEGTVELNVLVDEKGNVTDAQVVTGAGGKAGLNEAAIENVKRRKYRPASKDGVPVKVWVPVRVVFKLP